MLKGPLSNAAPGTGVARARQAVIWLALVLLWALSTWYASQGGRNVSDEWFHASQIARFVHGHFANVDPGITNIPGYHLLVAGVLRVFGSDGSLGSIRVVNAVFGLLAGAAFLYARRGAGLSHEYRATAQFLFLPLLFPYAFLAYTDVLSVGLILLALGFTLRQRHLPAAIAIVAAMGVRQNNVIWTGFLALMAAWPALREVHWRPWLAIRELLALVWPYLVAVTAFIAYWAWNGSITFSHVERWTHPDVSFHLGNPFFLLFLFAVFFPLQCATGLGRYGSAVRVRAWWLALPLVVFAIYTTGFAVSNVFNLKDADDFLHNAVLVAVVRHAWAWWLFGVLATLATCSLAFTRFSMSSAWMLFPFALFYLSTLWLIEGRYGLIPLALWLALRRQDSDASERLTLCLWVPLSVYFLCSVIDGRFML